MSRFTGGWVKVHRTVYEKWIGNDGVALAVFVKLLIMANWKESKRLLDGEELTTVKRGDVVTSARELAESLQFDRGTVERRLNLLEKEGTIIQKVSHRGRHITICNYDKYQKIDELDEPPNHHWTSNQTATEPPLNPHLVKKETNQQKKELKEFLVTEGVPPPVAAVQKITIPKKPKEPGKGTQTWEAYSKAYALRYSGHAPARNAKDNALCAQIVDRVGAEDAPKIAEFYVNHNDQWYVKRLHPLALLLTDIQKLRTEWLAGVQMTDTVAKSTQIASHNDRVIEEFKRKKGWL